MTFNAEEIKAACVKWIQEWFEENGKGCNVIIGISGGKDSSVAAGLMVEALGTERVYGIMMPNGVQADIEDSKRVIKHLGIQTETIDISGAVRGIIDENGFIGSIKVSNQTFINLPARIRMATLYAVSQSLNGRVVNTCNLSEDWIGYSTRYGDCAGDFSPLSQLTATEVRLVGYALGLPKDLIDKAPSDGLCGKTDEDNFGFTYAVLDKYIRTGRCEDADVKQRIDEMHMKNKFKMELMQSYDPGIEILAVA